VTRCFFNVFCVLAFSLSLLDAPVGALTMSADAGAARTAPLASVAVRTVRPFMSEKTLARLTERQN